MAIKPKNKRRIIWTIISIICALALAVIIIPPMITLNSFKPVIEQSIFEQTRIPLKLHGDIHFSLIGGTTIVAHNVDIPTANVGSIMFSIPFRNFFDLKNAKINDAVVIYDANITIDKLQPAMFNHNIKIYNSVINFVGRKFFIVRADFTDGKFHGIIRTKNHKYEVDFVGSTFNIKNNNNKLDIVGQMYTDGSTRGTMSIETNNINEWLGIPDPDIHQTVYLTTDFEWDGEESYKLTNIRTDNLSGNIEILSNGERVIQLVSDNLDFDFSILAQPSTLLHRTKINIDVYGNLTFQKHKINHLLIDAIGTNNQIQINKIIADNMSITGGTITKDGANNLLISMPFNKQQSTCLFSGTPDNWSCTKFTYSDMTGAISVNNKHYNIYVQSKNKMPPESEILKLASKIGTHGTIHFKFSNVGGKLEITDDKVIPTYDYADNKTLRWLNIKMPFLPDYMLSEVGNFLWQDDMLTFVPNSKKWTFATLDNYFYISGDNFKTWVPGIDLSFIQDEPYVVSGHYDQDKISNLTIKIKDYEFTGSISGKNVTLFTKKLSLDEFINPDFISRFEELEFLKNAPIMTLFELPINISLYSDVLIYKGNEYKNFTYSLKDNSQTFSITDSYRGNLLATIDKNKNNYKIFTQLNRFLINGYLLSKNMPLNIRDTMITAEAQLTTSGQIAHDIFYNLGGYLDITFNDGYLYGMSFDDFYASAPDLTILNAEYALANTLGGGETKLKKMHLTGSYTNGDFITTKPITISMRHTDAIGGLAISDGMMTAEFDITMRGTASTPATIQLSILPNGNRKYSLSDIIQNLDIGYMRAFINTHDKF